MSDRDDKLKFYDAANEADLACATNGGCVRPDCNGFLCRNAVDAVVSVECERCAQIVKTWGQDDECIQPMFGPLVAAIRSERAGE